MPEDEVFEKTSAECLFPRAGGDAWGICGSFGDDPSRQLFGVDAQRA